MPPGDINCTILLGLSPYTCLCSVVQCSVVQCSVLCSVVCSIEVSESIHICRTEGVHYDMRFVASKEHYRHTSSFSPLNVPAVFLAISVHIAILIGEQHW